MDRLPLVVAPGVGASKGWPAASAAFFSRWSRARHMGLSTTGSSQKRQIHHLLCFILLPLSGSWTGWLVGTILHWEHISDFPRGSKVFFLLRNVSHPSFLDFIRILRTILPCCCSVLLLGESYCDASTCYFAGRLSTEELALCCNQLMPEHWPFTRYVLLLNFSSAT